MKIAVLSPISWRTPPQDYGPWELFSSMITEELVKRGHKVTLFATSDSVTSAKLEAVVPGALEEDKFYGKGELNKEAGIWQSLHIAKCMERSSEFDIIHNNLNFAPLFYTPVINTPMVTTMHIGLIEFKLSKLILEIYKKYNSLNHYVSISNSARHPEIKYDETIYHGLDLKQFGFKKSPGDYLLVFGRMDRDKGVAEAISVAKKFGKKLILAGLISNEKYYAENIKPNLDGNSVEFIGSVGGEKKLEILKNAYALLHLVNFEEPFGLSVIEAMATGTPVVAMNRGAMPEIIENGKNGFLVKSQDEALDVLTKINRIDRMYCREFIEENFSLKRMVDNYERLFEKIIQSNK